MSHHTSENTLSPAEQEFMDLMQHGDDFFKIQLLRPAKSWYKKALELNLETEKVRQKIAECDRLLAFEIKVIRIVAALVVVLIILYFIF